MGFGIFYVKEQLTGCDEFYMLVRKQLFKSGLFIVIFKEFFHIAGQCQITDHFTIVPDQVVIPEVIFKLCKPGIAFQDTDILLQLFLRIKKISSNLKKNFCNEFKHAPTPFPVNLVLKTDSSVIFSV